jgi:ribose/xylose/arabinose/galactoside ABC-type transport system permease subunit
VNPASPSRRADSPPAWRRWLTGREVGLFFAIVAVVLCIIGLDRQGNFVSAYNRERLLHQFALLGVFSVGEAVVVIAGGIDLAPGSVIGFTSVLCALMLDRMGQNVPFGEPLPYAVIAGAIAVTLLAGVLIGFLHAFLITKLELPPFIATLGTLAGLRSAAQILTHSDPITVSDERFRALGDTWWVTLLIFLGIAILVGLLMNRTTLGRQTYAMGGNEAATRLSGVNVNLLKTFAYTLSAVLSAVAGILYTAYLGQGHPLTGVGYELNAIAAAVVGGCSLVGGSGSILGTGMGVALLVIVINGTALVIKRDSSLWEGIIVGVVIILAVAVNRIRFGKKAES